MIYFTSDQHFGHKNIIEYSKRPFKDMNEMQEVIIDNFNSIVKDSDEVYNLGDFSFHSTTPTQEIFRRLNGKKHIILGNHDRSPNSMKEIGFDKVLYHEHLTINNIKLFLRHIPDHRTHDDRKYKNKFLVESKWHNYMLCGHVHEKWKYHKNIINVGVDQWNFKPVSLEEIMEDINK